MRPTFLLAVAAAVLIAAPAAEAAPVTVAYTAVGESEYVVPAGVRRVNVALTGAAGGSQWGTTHGGRGALVSGTVAVTPGARLYAVVGGPGAGFGSSGGLVSSSSGYAGGANGGGMGSSGGGGASDVRTAPVASAGSLLTRLAVAGGGGGAGFRGNYPVVGGDAGMRGGDRSGGQGGGQPGTQTAGGAGGIAAPDGRDGTDGALGVGGEALEHNFRGGGGGGGYYGGGGGAGMGQCR